MDARKERWLKRHGYKPITDEVLWEQANKIFERFPERAEQWVNDWKATSMYYRRYGNEIIVYTERYFTITSIDELKRKHRRNIRVFVFNRMWLIKQIRGWWIRRWFAAHMRY